MLPSYIRIIKSHYKDPYTRTSIMECQQGLVHVAQLKPRWWKRRSSLNFLTEMLADDDAVMDRTEI